MNNLDTQQLQTLFATPAFKMLPVSMANASKFDSWEEHVQATKKAAVGQTLWGLAHAMENMFRIYGDTIESMELIWSRPYEQGDEVGVKVYINNERYSTGRLPLSYVSANPTVERMLEVDQGHAATLLFERVNAAIPVELNDFYSHFLDAFSDPVESLAHVKEVVDRYVPVEVAAELDGLILDLFQPEAALSVHSRPRI